MRRAFARGEKRARILLVENDPDEVELVRETLGEREGKPVIHDVPDGTRALEYLRERREDANASDPNLVLLDWDPPELDGEAVLRALRGDDRRPFPVVVVRDSSARADVRRAYDLGANAYLPKPAGAEEFADLLRDVGEFWLSAVQLPFRD